MDENRLTYEILKKASQDKEGSGLDWWVLCGVEDPHLISGNRKAQNKKDLMFMVGFLEYYLIQMSKTKFKITDFGWRQLFYLESHLGYM